MLAAIAEFERDLIRERTGEGRKRALAKGVKFGRKPKLSEYQRQEALKRRAAGETLAEIAKSYAVDVLSSDVDYLAVERSGSAEAVRTIDAPCATNSFNRAFSSSVQDLLIKLTIAPLFQHPDLAYSGRPRDYVHLWTQGQIRPLRKSN